MAVCDLNLMLRICDPFGFRQPGVTHEYGCDAVCATHGTCSVEDHWAHHRAASCRRRRAYLGLRRSFLHPGLCSRDGSRLSGPRSALPDATSRYLLRHACQKQNECAPPVLGSNRPENWRDLQSDNRLELHLRRAELSRTCAAHSLQESRVGQNLDLPDQQYVVTAADQSCAVHESLAGGMVLQMDQSAFAHHAISRRQRERRGDVNPVRRDYLRAHRHRLEGALTQCLARHIASDSFRLGLREKPDFMLLAARFICSRFTARH